MVFNTCASGVASASTESQQQQRSRAQRPGSSPVDSVDKLCPFSILRDAPAHSISAFYRVLLGEAAGAHIAGLLSAEYCAEAASRFEASSLRRQRRDGVPGYEVGLTQFRKTPIQLAKGAFCQQGAIRELVGDEDNPITHYFRQLALEGRQRGLMVRPACFAAEPMPTFRAIQWEKASGLERWLLQPHDDIAQVQAAINAGFEIKNVIRLVAFNFYIRSKPGSGQLVVYDWQPTRRERVELGVSETGYPYKDTDFPPDCSQHVFDQAAGDLVLLNGSFVHGVLVGADEVRNRLIINGFAALLEGGTVALFA